ncbi:MAG: hypothetical protein WC381_11775 [Kiritimatiellia bacterium]
MPNIVEILIAVVVALIGREGIGALLSARSQSRKTNTEAAVLASTTEWQRLNTALDAIQEENERLHQRVQALELSESKHATEIQVLRLGVVVLVGQLRAAGIDPVWEPSYTTEMLEMRRDGSKN